MEPLSLFRTLYFPPLMETLLLNPAAALLFGLIRLVQQTTVRSPLFLMLTKQQFTKQLITAMQLLRQQVLLLLRQAVKL